MIKRLQKDIGRFLKGWVLPSETKQQGAESLALAVEVLNKCIGIPSRVKEMEIDWENYKKLIPEMAKSALKDICTQGNVKGFLRRTWRKYSR